MATLLEALLQGKERQALALIEAGAPLDVQDDAGRTPLMLAIAQSYNAAAQKLLEKGADVALTDKFNRTVLDMARSCGNDIGRNMLFCRLDDVQVQAEAYLAAKEGDMSALTFLVDELRLSPTAKYAHGRSLVDEAALATQFEAQQWLEDKIAQMPQIAAQDMKNGTRRNITALKRFVIKPRG